MYLQNMRYRRTCLLKQYLLFFIPGIPYKKLSIPNCSSKTYKDKNNYYHSFEAQLGGRSRAKPESLVEVRVMGRVDPS